MKKLVCLVFFLVALSACAAPTQDPPAPQTCTAEPAPPPDTTCALVPPEYTDTMCTTPPPSPASYTCDMIPPTITLTWPALGSTYDMLKLFVDGTLGVMANGVTDVVNSFTVSFANFTNDLNTYLPKFVGLILYAPEIIQDGGVILIYMIILALMILVLAIKFIVKAVLKIYEMIPFKSS